MNPGAPIAPRTLFRALVTRALGEGGFHSAASLLLSPLSALAPEDEVWVSSAADFDAKAPHPTPVVLVHGFLGNPGHFRFLRRGLVARHLLERGEGARVRRLVTLGAPYLTDALPERESAIFGAADIIIPPPPLRLRGRSATVMGCGHLGLLYHPAVLRQVAALLGEPAEAPRKAARALRAA